MGTRGAKPPKGNGPIETSAGLKDERRPEGVGGDDVRPRTQAGLTAKSTPQDTYDTRAKNNRHGKVTADKWNQ